MCESDNDSNFISMNKKDIKNEKNLDNNNLNDVNNEHISNEKKEKSLPKNNMNNKAIDKDTHIDKILENKTLEPGPSCSSLGSLYNNISSTINTNSSSVKNVIKSLNLKKIKEYNIEVKNSNNFISLNKKKHLSKNKIININVPLYTRNENKCINNSYTKVKVKYNPKSFYKNNREYNNNNSLAELRSNKTNKIFSENFEKKNNSISFRNKNGKLKAKESETINNEVKKEDSHKIIKKKIKFNKKIINNLSENKINLSNLVSKKNSTTNFLHSENKGKSKLSEKNNIYTNNPAKRTDLIYSNKSDKNKLKIQNKMELPNLYNKKKLEKYNNLHKNKNSKNSKNLIKRIKSPFKQEEPSSSSEMLTSPLSITTSSYSNKLAPKEYPNMFLSSLRNQSLQDNKKKFSKKIKKIQAICKVGFSGVSLKKLNQDDYFIFPNFLNNSTYSFFGVCDGHGTFGQNISFYLKENLPQNVMNEFLKYDIQNLSEINTYFFSQIILFTFSETNKEMNEDERIDSSISGSTCVSVICTPERLFCINVGDSRCVLGKFDKNKNQWIPKNLSKDHKPSDPNEKSRIIKSGGRIESFMDEDGNYEGPERVWLKNEDTPGLAMSRSFGDEIAHTVGVIVSPDIYDYLFVEEDKFIILASDGIWEFMSSDEVVDIVKDFYLKNDLEGALEYLYKESSKRWITKENVIDDITVIIAFLD
jgi:serine/threonine protein phosphatase PrpC